MNYKKLILYLLLLFSNNTALPMCWFLEHPKVSSFLTASSLLLLLSRNYLFRLACTYNYYRIVQLCHPHHWFGYKIVDYTTYFNYNHNPSGPLISAVENKSKQTIDILLTYPDIISTENGYWGQNKVLKKFAQEDCQKVFDHFVSINTIVSPEDTFVQHRLKYAIETKDIILIQTLLKENPITTISENIIQDILAHTKKRVTKENCPISRKIVQLLITDKNIRPFIRLKAAIFIENIETVTTIISDPEFNLPEAMPREDWLVCYGLKSSTSTIAKLMITHKKINAYWYFTKYLERGFVDQSFLELVLENTTDKAPILLQTLYHILTTQKKPSHLFISFLLNHPEMRINEKIFKNNSENIFHQLCKKSQLIDLMNVIENVNFKSCDEQGITLFYRMCQAKVPLNKLTFFTNLSPAHKKAFAHNQLHIIAQKRNIEKFHPHTLDIEFLKICTEFGARFNERDKQGCRPVDIAYQAYIQAKKTLPYSAWELKRRNYYSFLEKTPYISDNDMGTLLILNRLNGDIIRKVMGYYKALTIDRDIVRQQSYNWPQSKYKEKIVKKEILEQICLTNGYLNPFIHHGNNTLRNRLAIT